MQVIIKALEPSDFDSLTKYYYEFYDEVQEDDSFGLVLFDERPSLLDEMNWFVGFQKAIEEGNAVALVAEADGKIVGFCEVDMRKPKIARFTQGRPWHFSKEGMQKKGNRSHASSENDQEMQRQIRNIGARGIGREPSCKELVRKVWIQALRSPTSVNKKKWQIFRRSSDVS